MDSTSTLGPATTLRGNVRGMGDLTIAGSVEGDVSISGVLTITETGSVRGNLEADSIFVGGAVQGNVSAGGDATIRTGARVVGDVTGARVALEAGASVRGYVRTEGQLLIEKDAPRREGEEGRKPRARTHDVRTPEAQPRQSPETPATPADAPAPPPKRPPPAPVIPLLGRGVRGKKRSRRS